MASMSEQHGAMGEPSSTPVRPTRRSARTPAKMPTRLPVATATLAQPMASSPSQGKRKARDAEKSSEEKLEYLLTNAKSGLTKLDIGVSGRFGSLVLRRRVRVC